ncbi:GIY-YIG nuclease family protein [Pontibacter sp. G13]|uniref:GIY-YIG nuclease family protein n=1 Tax=Pontibacter sp. G13 TaxID=3074898 RepID=UPI003906AB3F
MEHEAYVYMMTNSSHTALYVGVTKDLPNRIHQHKSGEGSSHVQKYRIHKLVFYRGFHDLTDAFDFEKNWNDGNGLGRRN